MARAKDRSKHDSLDETKVGGIGFFISFLALLFLTGLCLYCLPPVLKQARYLENWLWFIAGCCLGHFVGRYLIRGHPSVLLHEWKHSLISTLVGNKWKSMRVKDRSGHFEYEYTKRSARFNAFISLAPYWIPLFTGVLLGIGYAALYPKLQYIAVLAGLGYGADLTLNLRDISPVQSDITDIRGGYTFGLCYIIVVNVFVALLLCMWISDGGMAFKNLGTSLIESGTQLRQLIRS